VLRISSQRLEESLLVLLLPRDPLDEKNIMLEIRAGTGGDEASIWAGDLLRMYQKYCVTQGWKNIIINWNDGEAGGYKEVTLEIQGDSVYSKLKYEAGTHAAPFTFRPVLRKAGVRALFTLVTKEYLLIIFLPAHWCAAGGFVSTAQRKTFPRTATRALHL
jgi:hypothetical protein